jgi:hypothetical protein
MQTNNVINKAKKVALKLFVRKSREGGIYYGVTEPEFWEVCD